VEPSLIVKLLTGMVRAWYKIWLKLKLIMSAYLDGGAMFQYCRYSGRMVPGEIVVGPTADRGHDLKLGLIVYRREVGRSAVVIVDT